MSAQQNPSTWTPPPQAQGLSRPATATSAAAPKKAGPATFEEMGIPAQKKDAECVSYASYNPDDPLTSTGNDVVPPRRRNFQFLKFLFEGGILGEVKQIVKLTRWSITGA